MKHWCITTILVAGLVGCNEPAPDASASPTSTIPEWSVTLEARIGSVDDPDRSITRVGQIIIGPNERLYVSQPMDDNVRVYDAHAKLVTTIGRPGRGPGEFGQLSYIGLSGDTLYAAEVGRLSFFSLDGRFLTSKLLTAEPIRTSSATYWPAAPQVYVPLPDGTALVKAGVAVPAVNPNETGVSAGIRRVPLFRLNPRSQVVDTAAWVETGGVSIGFAHEGTVFRFPSPFNDSPMFALMPNGGGIVVVHRRPASDTEASTFRVTRVRPSGDTAFSQSFRYRPVPLQPEWVRGILEQTPIFPTDHRNPPGASEMVQALRDAGLIPATLVPVTALAAGQDGSIWLRREDVPGDSATWEVLARDGRRQGAVRLSARQTVVAATEDVLVALEKDVLDVPYIVQYRVRRP